MEYIFSKDEILVNSNLKENCNEKKIFFMKECSKCWRTICISRESVKTVLELLIFKVRPGNHQKRISLLQKFSEIFGNLR